MEAKSSDGDTALVEFHDEHDSLDDKIFDFETEARLLKDFREQGHLEILQDATKRNTQLDLGTSAQPSSTLDKLRKGVLYKKSKKTKQSAIPKLDLGTLDNSSHPIVAKTRPTERDVMSNKVTPVSIREDMLDTESQFPMATITETLKD